MTDLAAWVALIERLAPHLLGPGDRTGEALAAEVRRVSELYTRERRAIDAAATAHAARLRFFLPRDLAKVLGPLEELGEALPEGPTWRVIDVGAGLGTTSLGVAAAAKARGAERVEVVALERDAAALDVFAALARGAEEAGLAAPIALDARPADLGDGLPGDLGEADLVVMGLALNELDRDLAEEARLDAHEALLGRLLDRLAPGGALVVLEPALRETSRHLQRLRARLEPRVFAPCLRGGECPLLRRERDWCHAAAPVELPPALAKIARAAGLRGERLTYAYLTLRRDGRRLAGYGDPSALRIVGGPIESKGKTEWDACGPAGLVRLRRLDRERGVHDAALDGALRGRRIRAEAPLEDGAALRLRPGTRIERI